MRRNAKRSQTCGKPSSLASRGNWPLIWSNSMSTIYTLSIMTALIIAAAFYASAKWGMVVSGIADILVVAILRLQFWAGRW